jgi:hypothetical protein
VNSAGATVGSLLGDGLVLKFSDPSEVVTLRICLLVSGVRDTEKYPIADFGSSTSLYQYINPLSTDIWLSSKWIISHFYSSPFCISPQDISQVEVWNVVQSTFWCADVLLAEMPMENDTIRVFPIERVSDFSSVSDSYTSNQTKDLMYILGAWYVFVGFLCILALVRLNVGILPIFPENLSSISQMLMIYTYRFTHTSIISKKKNRNRSVSLPFLFTVIFIVLCTFRATFLFLYPSGKPFLRFFFLISSRPRYLKRRRRRRNTNPLYFLLFFNRDIRRRLSLCVCSL